LVKELPMESRLEMNKLIQSRWTGRWGSEKMRTTLPEFFDKEHEDLLVNSKARKFCANTALRLAVRG
jgi:hypothetical protein